MFNDPHAITQAAVPGAGFALLALAHLLSGVPKRLPAQRFLDDGPISLYLPGQRLLPHMTREFVDYLVGELRVRRIAERLKAG